VAVGLGANETWEQKETHILEEFRTHAARYEHKRDLAGAGKVELAMWAQHHGAPTRFLDWTLNPLAALYFAVEDERDDEHDAAAWAIAGHRGSFTPSPPYERFPGLTVGVEFLLPPRLFHRSATQASILAVWGDARRPLEEVVNSPDGLWKIIVPNEVRPHVRWSLHCLGINRQTLFPDLDGLGRYLRWKHSRTHEAEFVREGRPDRRDAADCPRPVGYRRALHVTSEIVFA
jgi:FRG domain